MHTIDTGMKRFSTSSPPPVVKRGKNTEPNSQLDSAHSVNSSATAIPNRTQYIESLLHKVENKTSLRSVNAHCCAVNQKLFATEFKLLITNYGYQYGVQFLSQWPENKKNQTWFYLIISCLFTNREPSISESIITELTLQKDSDVEPIAYLTILKKLQTVGGLRSPAGFKEFMDWLVCWNLSEVQPGVDLLKNIPDEIRKMRPDLPIIEDSGIKMADDLGWGNLGCSLENYLANTQWIQYFIIYAFIEHAPVDFIQPVIESWLEADDTTAIRDKLFAQEQHPLSVQFSEPRPWNIMLAALDRLLPGLESEFSQDISKLDGSDQPVEKMDENFTGKLNLPRESFVFGRTIAFLDPKNLGHLYLKFQSRDESDKVFFQEAQRLKYFYDNRQQFSIEDSALNVKDVLKVDSLKKTLSDYQLSAIDKARLFLRCAKDDCSTNLHGALQSVGTFSSMNIKIAEGLVRITHPHALPVNDIPLTEFNKRKIIEHLNKIDPSCHMMLLQAPAGYHYEQYIYDLEDYDSIIKGLISYVKEFGAMWSEGVIGPDSCSVFHNKNADRDYDFLSPYFDQADIGTVDQWTGISTDFPNVGPIGCRDRGDVRVISELDAEKLHSSYEQGENHDKLLARGTLEALAKTAWGTILLYGRSLKETFNSNDPNEVARIKDDVGAILGALFSKAFHIPQAKCLELMNSQNLLAQTAREISYWMSTDYVADLRSGLIPQAVYPDYKGIREGHVLSQKQADFLSDDGFKGDYFGARNGDFKGNSPSVHLGARNGINPLMALNAMVVKMLSHGCLNLFKIQKAQSEMDTDA